MATPNKHPKYEEFMKGEKEEYMEDKKKEIMEVDKQEFMEVGKKELMEVEKEEFMEDEKKELTKIPTEEEQFVKLFDAVLQQNKGKLSDEEIANGVVESIKTFQRDITGSCVKENLDTPQKLCGFFYRYGPLSAGVTRNKFLVAFRNCEELGSCFHRPSLKIVDVGSGAGSALVGLYSAIYDEGFRFQSLDVTAVDYEESWKKIFNDIVVKLETEFGNASKLFKEKTIECSFECIDALSNDGNEMKEKIKEADMILIKGVLSVFKEYKERVKVSEDVASAMKSGSLLVIIESPTYEKYFQVKNLKLVFTTRKYLPDSAAQHSTSQNTSSGSQDSELIKKSQAHDSSYDKWEPYDCRKRPDLDDRYNLTASEVNVYGPGLARSSNQQIFVLEKVESK